VLGTLLLILSLGLNAVALMKAGYRIFWGIPVEGLSVKPLTVYERYALSLLVGLFGLLGLMASHVYRFVVFICDWIQF
jgi:hypothetical protein